MRYDVTIRYTDGTRSEHIAYSKDVSSLDELKESFLKRFGNIHDVPNRLLAEKPIVKQLTYEAKTIAEWQESIQEHTRWALDIRLG